MKKEERYNELNNNAKEFKAGVKVKTYDLADVTDHMEINKNIVGKDGVVSYSKFFQKCLDENKINNYGCNKYGTKAFIYIEHNYTQKEEESVEQATDRINDNLSKDRENLNAVQNEIDDTDNKIKELKTKNGRNRTALSREKKKKKPDQAKINKLEKENAKLNEKIKELKNNKKDLQSKLKKYDKNIKRNEANIEKLENLEKETNNKENTINSVKANRKQLDVNAIKNGITIKSKSYDKELQDKIYELDTIYIDKKSKEYKDAKKKLLEENKDMVHNVETHYEYVSHTSSKGRKLKDFYCQDWVSVDGGKKDYSQSIVYDYVLDENNNVVNKTLTNIADPLVQKQKAIEAYNEYKKAVEDKKPQEVIDKLYKKAQFKTTEYDSYVSLNQSTITQYTKPMESKNILIMPDFNVDVEVEAVVETVEYRVYTGKDKAIYRRLTEEQYNRLSAKEKDLVDVVPKLEKKKVKLQQTLNDGQAMIDKTVVDLPDDYKFCLLRGEEFKCGANVMDIQGILKAMYEADGGKNFDKAYVTDYYGNKVLLKDVRLITTENSTKFNKLATGTKAEEWKKWCKNFDEVDGGFLGIVKTEHASKQGAYQYGNYQQIISLNLGDTVDEVKENAEKLVQSNIDRINDLKDDDKFVEFVINQYSSNAEDTIGFATQDVIYSDMLKRNKDFIKTEEFRAYKASKINQLKEEIKHGNLLLHGDNMTIMGDPMPLLCSVIKGHNEVAKNIDKYSLFRDAEEDNRVRVITNTKMFEKDTELAITRSPHAGDFSLNVGVNVYDDDLHVDAFKGVNLNDYMELGRNQMIIDDRHKPIAHQTGGSDKDSDVFQTFDDKELVNIYKRSYIGKNKVPVPYNNIPNSTTTYLANAESQVEKDFKVGSGKLGEIANFTAQVECQYSYARQHVGETVKIGGHSFHITENTLNEMENIIYRGKNAMDLAIDNAKRVSVLDVNKELARLRNSGCLFTYEETTKTGRKVIKMIKPSMMEWVQQDAGKTFSFDDNLTVIGSIVDNKIENASKLNKADKKDILDLIDNIKISDLNSNERKSVKRVEELMNQLDRELKTIQYLYKDDTSKEALLEKAQMISFRQEEYKKYLDNLLRTKVKGAKVYLDKNCYKLLIKDAFTKQTKVRDLILKTLYSNNKKLFINILVEGEKSPSSDSLIKIATEVMEKQQGYAQKIWLDLNDKIDEFYKSIDKNIYDMFYTQTVHMDNAEKQKFLNEYMSKDKVNILNKKWGIKEFNIKMSNIEGINKDIKLTTDKLLEVEKKLFTNLAKYNIEKGYNNTVKKFEQVVGKKYDIKGLDKDTIEKIINKKYFSDNMNYLDRLNNNIGKFYNFSTQDLENWLVNKSVFSSKELLKSVWENHKHANNRLVVTETTLMTNNGVALAYKDMNFTILIYVSVLEKNTCKHCSELDGTEYILKDVVEERIPHIPAHPHCKCTWRVEINN